MLGYEKSLRSFLEFHQTLKTHEDDQNLCRMWDGSQAARALCRDLSDSRYGFAARCEAGLSPAVNLVA